MGKRSKKNKQVKTARPANAAAGQIVRVGEKERCTLCKNWIPFGFSLKLGPPPHRIECGKNAKCDNCGLNLCHRCLDAASAAKEWNVCSNNLTGRQGQSGKWGENLCLAETPVKFCGDCDAPYIKSKRRQLEDWRGRGGSEDVISDMEHQKDMQLIYCGGFDRGTCMAMDSVREPIFECRDCALSGQRKMRVCYLCGKIRCVQCVGHASDKGGSAMGLSGGNTPWDMATNLLPGFDDLMKSVFVADCIKRCGSCQRDVCMECVSKDTLTSNMSKGRLFDCKESGCRCLSCMTKERMDGKVEGSTSFHCDECRLVKKKCNNPECTKPFEFNCSRCGKGRYCSKECQVVCWPSHKAECLLRKEKAKAKKAAQGGAKGDKKPGNATKMKKSEAQDIVGDVLGARDRYYGQS